MAKKSRAPEGLLNELHAAVARDLLAKVKSGEASAQELNAAIKFLKDNGIEAERTAGSEMDQLSNMVLPEFDDDMEDGINESLN
jgi:CRISPR/Cas system CSM-associated protein Csm4 (group 5 of RAMP superfamily)